MTSGLRGAGITLEEARGEVETARRMGILAHYRRDMERYLSWEEELGRKYEAGS